MGMGVVVKDGCQCFFLELLACKNQFFTQSTTSHRGMIEDVSTENSINVELITLYVT